MLHVPAARRWRMIATRTCARSLNALAAQHSLEEGDADAFNSPLHRTHHSTTHAHLRLEPPLANDQVVRWQPTYSERIPPSQPHLSFIGNVLSICRPYLNSRVQHLHSHLQLCMLAILYHSYAIRRCHTPYDIHSLLFLFLHIFLAPRLFPFRGKAACAASTC